MVLADDPLHEGIECLAFSEILSMWMEAAPFATQQRPYVT